MIIRVAKRSVYFRRIHVISRIYIQISILFDRFLLTLHREVSQAQLQVKSEELRVKKV